MTPHNEPHRIPARSWRFWALLGVVFTAAMLLTMLKDWWLTGEKPVILFYITVPAVSMLGGVLSMYAAVKLGRLPVTFLEILAAVIGVNIAMQTVEIALKLIYYLAWEYPGWLYLVVVIPGGIVLGAFVLVGWCSVRWRAALVLMLIEVAGELLASVLFTAATGLSTPGS